MSAVSPPGSAVELQHLLAELDKSSPAPYPLASELLAAQHIHDPKLVVKYGKQLILHHKSKLGDKGQRNTRRARSTRPTHPLMSTRALVELTVCVVG